MMGSAKCDDFAWDEKDEDDILNDLLTKTAISKNNNVEPNLPSGSEEYISGPAATEEYLKQQSIVAACASQSLSKITTADLRKFLQKEPLDLFLYACTYEPSFFTDQVAHNDSQERVLLYARILTILCDLAVPGFHEDILHYFANNEILLEHFRIIATKLFSKRYKTLWTTNEQHVDEIIHDMQTLLLQSQKASVLTSKCIELMQHIKMLIDTSDSPSVAERSACKEFANHLTAALCLEDKQHETHEPLANNTINEIYPTLDDLFHAYEDIVAVMPKQSFESVTDYLSTQKQLLREDFMIPMREFVREIKQNRLDSISTNWASLIYEDVCIVLNDQFLKAHRHEMLFVDVYGSLRDVAENKKRTREKRHHLRKLKTGSMLCFTTSKDFDNLILATVSYTDNDLLNFGYIGIEVVRQYNIGNIYDKSLLMFETPAFFEPYQNVYNYLNSCCAADFPMKDYIVFGETNINAPTYLDTKTIYTYENCKFAPLQPPSNLVKLPLNLSQWSAYQNALSQEFCLIQGPPGTGKTHLSVHLVKTLIENAATPIVLITYTNESLDKVLLKISAYTDNIVRFGSQNRIPEINKYNITASGDKHIVNPRLKRLYYVTDLEFKLRFQKLQSLIEEFDGTDESYQQILLAQQAVAAVARKLYSIRIMFQYYIARQKGIIAMTTTCAAKTNFLFRLLKSSIVIFEEAAEILESHVIACLTPYTQHVIMIGDHMQLQPYTTSFQHSRTHEMNISLFERLIKNNLKPSILNMQYRMRPVIADLIRSTIYDELYNNDVVETYPEVRNMHKNLYFLTHKNSESKLELDSSIYNEFEVDNIIKLARYLISEAEYESTDIVILSPYAQQVEKIKMKLTNCNDKDVRAIKTATVDSFQGLEANIVLLSLVRNNNNGQIGFLKEKNRICVALSRAKHGMYIIGNIHLLSRNSSVWKAIKQKLEAQDAIGAHFPYGTLNDDKCTEFV